MNRVLLNAFILLTFLVSVHYCLQICLGVNSGDALSAVSNAELRVVACYRAVVDAERDSANVTELVGLLNQAGWLLSRAKLAYNYGDYESAVKYAGECLLMLDGFTEHAEILRREAKEARQRDFMLNFVGSGVGALCIAVGGYAAWLYLTRREKSGGA